jgi:ABC-2 type transport system permease protein
MPRVAVQAVADRVRALPWWTAGIVALVAVNVAFWPTISEQHEELNRLIETYPEALLALFGAGGGLDIASEPGFLDSQIFAFMAPVVFLIYALGFGAGAIAGEEDRGTMELLLANPVSRRRLVLEKAAALAVTLAALSVALFLSVWLGGIAAGMEIGPVDLGAATLSLFLLSLAFGLLALCLGSLTGRRGTAVGVAAAFAVGGYLLQSLGPLVAWLEPWTVLSPFAHYASGDRLRDGLDAGAAGVLLALALALAAAAAAAFERRDLRL